MADLVGLIVSVLQFVDTVAKARNYIQDFRNAPQEQKQLVLEIQNLDPLIRKLDERISDDEAHGSATILQHFKDPLRQLETMLERLVKKLDPDGIKKFSSRLTWPLWGKEDVNGTLQAIERFKSSLTASLGMEISDSAKDISESVRNIAVNQEQYHNSAERRQIIEWVSPLNFFPRQADILSARQPGTGEWLLQDTTFKRWKASETRTIWCRGMPGAGKTVLTSIVVNNLRENLANETIGVAVLYLDHKATEAHTPTNLLAGIWQQLAPGKPMASLVHELYNKHRERSTRPSLQEIYSELHAAVSDCTCIFVVVDALDEYPEEHRDTLLRHLWNLGSTARLMLTSRPHIGVDHIIPNIETLDVRASEEDIRRYLEGQILKSSRLSRHVNKPSGLRESIEDKIVKRSDGMFLLAKLHIDSLLTKQTVAAVRDALLRLPSDLDGTYNDIVDRINRQSKDDRALAWRTLSWVLNAKQPLRPSQLREALAIPPGATELDPDRLTDMDIILSVCAGLVTVDEVGNQVRVIHYTTQMYFQSADVYASLFPHAQSEITLTCMVYMSLTFEAFSHKLQNPLLLFTDNQFLHYTVEYCLTHAHGEPETHIPQSILSFLANCSVWWRLWNWKHGGRQSAPNRFHIARAFNLEVICAHIIRENEAGRSLQKAILQGATDSVRILVEEGISAENEDDALESAIIHGRDEIVGLLLAHSPSDRKSRGRFGAALYQASARGNASLVESLLMHGADINADGGDCGSALQLAAYMGNDTLIELLIDHGADVGAKGGHYGTAVQVAVRKGREEATKLLLKHGADANAAKDLGDLLQVAVCEGHERIARLLIQHGAIQHGYAVGPHTCSNALCAASSLGHRAIVQLFLDLGADVNAKGGKFGTALQAALWNGQVGIARLLIQHGANPDTPGVGNGTALCAASRLGYIAIVQQLLDLGAPVNARGGKYGSAVEAAHKNGHQSIVKLLVEHGADFNPNRGPSGTSLPTYLQAVGAGATQTDHMEARRSMIAALRTLREGAGSADGDLASLNNTYGFPQNVVIGKGATSIIRLAHQWDWSAGEKLYVVKEVRQRRKAETEKDYIKKLTAEFCISSTLKHINILETVDLLHDEQGRWCEIMEFCAGGDLYTAIKKGGMSPGEVECCFKQILCGVGYLHSQGVAHRDLKPENLLFDAKGLLKIGDYDTATVYRLPWEQAIHMSWGLCGSEPYIAPEQFLGEPYDARLVDIWACGIIYHCMHLQELPWRAALSSDQLYAAYVAASTVMPAPQLDAQPSPVTPERPAAATDSEATSASTSPDSATERTGTISARPPADDLFSTSAELELVFPPTIMNLAPRACRPLIRKMLEPDPKLRSTIEELLECEWVRGIEVCWEARGKASHVHVNASGIAGLMLRNGEEVTRPEGGVDPWRSVNGE